MNNKERGLLQSVCENNMFGAKKYARCILLSNKAESNEYFCKEMLHKLDMEDEMVLPANLKGLLFVEDPKETFKESRYYLSSREQAVSEKIFRMCHASQKLAELGVNYVNSTMLYGESGTGKTTFGRYIAYKLGLPFAYLNLTRVIDSYLGATSKNVSAIFDYVNGRKCVLMLDEIDAIGMARKSKNEVGELSRIVIGLMQNLDQLTGDTVVIGATNRLDIIDPALLRRFTVRHEVVRPDREERLGMVRKFFGDVGYDIPEDKMQEFAEPGDTQAGLENRMVMELVNYYSEQEGTVC